MIAGVTGRYDAWRDQDLMVELCEPKVLCDRCRPLVGVFDVRGSCSTLFVVRSDEKPDRFI